MNADRLARMHATRSVSRLRASSGRREFSDAFERLESRALLSPTVLNVGVAPNPAPVAGMVVVTVDASPAASLRAASFFRDVNANGGWDPGIDQALGDSFTQVSAGRFQKSIVVGEGWSPSTRIMANVVDTSGTWAMPRTAMLSVVEGPIVTSLRVSPDPAEPGGTALVTVDAISGRPLRAMSVFRDVNRNGAWDAGVDQALGDTFTQVSPGRFQKTIAVGVGWDATVRIVANVVDTTGVWGASKSALLTVGSPPEVTSLIITPELATAGAQLVMNVFASASRPLVAATFFRDLNANGKWDPGIDRTLGDSFTLAGPGRFQKTVTIGTDWGRNTVIVANVVDLIGQWGVAQSQIVTANQRPQVTSALLSTTTPEIGQSIRAYAAGIDDVAISVMTAFIDVDESGRWTPGVDRWLADDTTPDPLTGVFEFSFTTAHDWPPFSIILVDARDTNGAFAVRPLSAGTVRLNTPPVVGSLRVGIADATPNDPVNPLLLSASVSDDTTVVAVRFWLDLDGNGAWTEGADQMLGESRARSQNGDFTLSVGTALAGLPSAVIGAEAMDLDGRWSVTPRTVEASLPRLPLVTRFFADSTGGSYDLDAEAWFAPTDADASAPVQSVMFVADANFNGVFDASDVLIASVVPGAHLEQGWRHHYVTSSSDLARLPASFQWLAVPVFAGPDGAVRGAARAGLTRQAAAQEPLAASLLVEFGLDALDHSAPATPGNYFRATARGQAGSGVQGVTFFWDRNLNGRWESGVDVDLGYVPLAGGVTETAVLRGVITQAMAGPGAINASVRTGGTVWSAPRSAQIDRVIAGPTLEVSNVSLSAGWLTVEINATDDFGVSSITGAIDLDHDGLDADDPVFSMVRYSGTTRSGGWRLVINVTGIAPNTIINFRGVNFYRGDSGNGLLSNILPVTIPGPW